jgi:hypothetical protein
MGEPLLICGDFDYFAALGAEAFLALSQRPLKLFGIADRHLGEHLAVDLDARLIESIDQAAVADAVGFAEAAEIRRIQSLRKSLFAVRRET